jgi:hypothetical protein
MATKKNIIIGAAQVYLGPSWDTTNGANPAPAVVDSGGGQSYVTTMNASGTWINVGYTQDGVEVATDPTWDDVEVDQLLDAAKIFKSGMSLTVATTFAEATLENLLIAWGQATSTLNSFASYRQLDIDGGSLGAAPLERGLIAVGNAPEKTSSNNYGERTYHAYRVLSVESVSHTLARAEATVVPVTFRALPGDNGKYGYVRDRMALP